MRPPDSPSPPRQGLFANRLYDMPRHQWEQALAEPQRAGIELRWTHGTIADDPTVTGGWVLPLAATRTHAAAHR